MKVEQLHTIGFFDVDHNSKLTFQAAARFFQDMATLHSEKVGCGFKQLQEQGVIWFLNSLEIEMVSSPMLMDTVRLMTWSRKIDGVKGYREYLIQSLEGKTLVKGSSVWLFVDLNKKRIARVPDAIARLYKPEKETLFLSQLDEWMPKADIDPVYQQKISLRYSDFDINGHVNNTIYFGFLETLYQMDKTQAKPPLRNIRIRFNREIGRENEQITAGWARKGEGYACRIYNATTVFALGYLCPLP